MIVGKTGQGKTHLLQHLAWLHMQQGHGLLFLDFHGDATAQLTTLAALHPEAPERFVLVDPTNAESSPGINPLERSGGDFREVFTRASELSIILRQRWGVDSFGARTEQLLMAALFTAAAHNLTLVDVLISLLSSGPL